MRKFLGAEYPGYVVHEAIGWSEQLKKYVVLPRRISSEAYDEKVDEERGTNQALIISEDFSSIKKIQLGPQDQTHGFSSFKFVPWRENEIVALKTKEHRETTETYITVFDLTTQEVLLEETLISDSIKFEGVEFL
jgi:soluble calcium-activated nucleotidase 1